MEAPFPGFVRARAATDDGVVARGGSTTMVPSGARCKFPRNVEGGGKPTVWDEAGTTCTMSMVIASEQAASLPEWVEFTMFPTDL